jgi:hypothetical protein
MGMSSRNFRRRNHRRRGKPQGESPEPRQAIPAPECPVCAKPIRELSAALCYRGTDAPAHFDCVLKELRETHEILPQEKLCYLGGGNFAILQFKTGGGNKFTIKKKIPYEGKEIQQEWKKALLIPG